MKITRLITNEQLKVNIVEQLKSINEQTNFKISVEKIDNTTEYITLGIVNKDNKVIKVWRVLLLEELKDTEDALILKNIFDELQEVINYCS